MVETNGKKWEIWNGLKGNYFEHFFEIWQPFPGKMRKINFLRKILRIIPYFE